MFGTFEADLVLFEEKIGTLEKRILTPLVEIKVHLFVHSDIARHDIHKGRAAFDKLRPQ